MSELNLYQLRVFYSVARLLSYSKAGEELALSQPAVSRQVSGLENSLHLKLFIRRGRKIMLTGAGRSLFEYADKIFDLAVEAERVMEQFKDLERGELIIGTSTNISSYLLPPVLQDFYEKHPKIDTRVHLGNSAAIEQLVMNGEVDIGLVSGPIKDAAFYVEPYFRDELVMVISPAHPLADKKKVCYQDLTEETLIWRERGSAVRALTEEFLIDQAIEFKKIFEISDTETIKRMIMTGMGVAFIPRTAIALEVSVCKLKVLGVTITLPVNISIISTKVQHYYPSVLAFINFLRKSLNNSRHIESGLLE